ncbi:MAG: glycoside hydrolase family 172 protein [Bacteroidales bacterium]
MRKITTLPLILMALVLLALVGSCQTKTKKVTLSSLLKEMTTPTLLTEYPSPAFTCKQFSSYDRRSVAPDQPGWFANHDASWFIREESINGRREFVMLEADGPGAVVRFWMTFGNEAAYTGTLRMYFDGNDIPEVEGPVLELISGAKLAPEPLSSSVSPLTAYAHRGHNLYLPIPYASGLKITYECDALDSEKHSPSVYYNINYRTYEPGTQVESFTLAALETYSGEMEETIARLTNLDHSGTVIKDTKELERGVGNALEPGKSLRYELKGPGAVYQMSIRLEAENLPQALRSTVIQATFDGELTVWCPAGDFFGTGYQIRPYSTWNTATDSSGMMTSHWVMPYRKSAVIEVINMGDQPVQVYDAITTGKYRWTTSSMHFGAIWHEFHQIDAKGYQGNHLVDLHEDINFVTLNGQGVYAGDAITLFNTADAWWGEGDEKVYVDGEEFPSHFGTGTEDYIGYAWCRPEIFDHFLIAQPDGSGNFHPGMSVNMRHRMLDAIPFNTGIKFDMELWHWATTRMNYAVVSYWYMKPGGECLIKPNASSVKEPVALKRASMFPPVPDLAGVLQGEHLRVVSLTAGNWEIQNSSAWGWSNNQQLWWLDGGVDGQLKAEFEMATGGDYTITANFTKAVDYGNFKMMINDQPVNLHFKGYHNGKPVSVTTEVVNLGRFQLKEGINTLQVSITGKEAAALPRYMVGIDYLKIRND